MILPAALLILLTTVTTYAEPSAVAPHVFIHHYLESFYPSDTAIVWATIILAFVLGISVLVLSLAVIRRRRAEVALREKTEELDRYFTNSLDLLCIADRTGRFIRLNPEWERVFGFPLADLQGQRYLDFIHPDDRESTIKAVENLATKKRCAKIRESFSTQGWNLSLARMDFLSCRQSHRLRSA